MCICFTAFTPYPLIWAAPSCPSWANLSMPSLSLLCALKMVTQSPAMLLATMERFNKSSIWNQTQRLRSDTLHVNCPCSCASSYVVLLDFHTWHFSLASHKRDSAVHHLSWLASKLCSSVSLQISESIIFPYIHTTFNSAKDVLSWDWPPGSNAVVCLTVDLSTQSHQKWKS